MAITMMSSCALADVHNSKACMLQLRECELDFQLGKALCKHLPTLILSGCMYADSCTSCRSQPEAEQLVISPTK